MSRGLRGSWLVVRAWYELARYDLVYAVRGFGGIGDTLRRPPSHARTPSVSVEQDVADAVSLAACFYWKPVRCLQRAVCTTRLLQARGVPAMTVIGYRANPFLSHAWVEVDSRVVNDSPVYRERLRVLDVIQERGR